MSTIGRYLSALAAGWNNPTFWSGEMQDHTYVPNADASMTDSVLELNYNDLLYKLNFWKQYPAANSTEQGNINIVIAGYEQKKLAYDAIRGSRQSSTNVTVDPDGNIVTTEPKENKMMLPLLIGGAAILFFMMKNKKP